jgi:hypothetical protein
MITSVTRHEDLQTYADLMEILSVSIRICEKNPTAELVKHIEEVHERALIFKEHIEKHNYHEDDMRRSRVDKALKLAAE